MSDARRAKDIRGMLAGVSPNDQVGFGWILSWRFAWIESLGKPDSQV
jgi:hypothetical protein